MESILSYEGDGAFFRCILEVLFNSFFHRCKEISFFVGMKTYPSGLFLFSVIIHFVFIISIIRYAWKKGLSIIFTFILCFSITSLGAFAIIYLIGNKEVKSFFNNKPDDK
jgi:hypothetical protein